MEIINANYQYTSYLLKHKGMCLDIAAVYYQKETQDFFPPSILNSIEKIHPKFSYGTKNAIMVESWITTSDSYKIRIGKKAYLWQNNKPCQKGINRRQKKKIQEKFRA